MLIRIKDLKPDIKIRVCVNKYSTYGRLINYFIPYYKATYVKDIDPITSRMLITKMVDHRSHIWVEVIKIMEG